MDVQVSLHDSVFSSSGYIPRILLDHMVVLILIFQETSILFHNLTILANVCKGAIFPQPCDHLLLSDILFCSFLSGGAS